MIPSTLGGAIPNCVVFNCDRVIRWCTIVIIVVVPLIFTDAMNSSVMPKVMLFRSLVEIMAVAWMIRSMEDRDWRWTWDALSIAVVAYGSIVFAATVMGIGPWVSFWGSYDRMEGFVTIAHLIAFFAIVRGSLDGARLRRVVCWMVGASAIASLMAIAQRFGLDPTRYTTLVEQRVIGTLENPLTLGAYLVMIIPWSVWLMRFSATMKGRLLVLGSILAQIVALYFSLNRGSWLALIGSLTLTGILWCIVSRRWRLAFVPLVGAALIIGGGIFAARMSITTSQTSVNRFVSIFALQDTSATNRFLLWSMASRAIKEHPVLGYGPEQQRWALAHTYDPRLSRSEYVHYDRAHNQWLDIGVTQGFSGVIVFLVIALLIYSMGMRLLFKNTGDDFRQWTLLALLATFTAYYIQNFSYFDTISTAVFFWFFVAVIGSQKELIPTPSGRHPPHPNPLPKGRGNSNEAHRGAYWMVGVAGGLVMIAINIMPWAKDRVYSSALKTRDIEKVTAAADSAVRWNPFSYSYHDHFGRLMIDVAIQLGRSGSKASAVELFERAQQELSHAVRENPYYVPSLDAMNYLSTVWTEVDSSKFPIAEKGYRDMIRLAPGRVPIYWDLAYLYAQMGRKGQALETINTAIAVDPENGGSYHRLYAVYEQFGQEDSTGAQQALERANALRYVNR